MKKLYYLSVMYFIMMLISCTSTYRYSINNPSDKKLERNKIIAIATSEDGLYGSDIYTGSGRILSHIIKKELITYSSKTIIFENKESIIDFSEEDISKYDYVIIPEILHWEDRATAWSGLPDKVEFSVNIYNSKRELLKSTVLSGKSARMTLRSTDPSELIEKPLNDFFKSVFQ
ncbi:DUF4823 domain-containing protein [Treponema socranskii]|uniref:DUF4823 domain-containing protein n=1 Tax=Treponema socranskii TaxID=53419 RepID=UPI003D8A9451